MKLSSSSAAAALLSAALFTPAAAQLNSLSNVLSVIPPQKLVARPSETITAEFRIQLRNGYHVNSNKPADPYLIPLRFTWLPGAAQVLEVQYPAPKMERFEFSQKPVSVFDGEFKTTARVKVGANPPRGPLKLEGKLRYQACNDKMCLPPRTIDVSVPLEIR
jgi:hypothetical protein